MLQHHLTGKRRLLPFDQLRDGEEPWAEEWTQVKALQGFLYRNGNFLEVSTDSTDCPGLYIDAFDRTTTLYRELDTVIALHRRGEQPAGKIPVAEYERFENTKIVVRTHLVHNFCSLHHHSPNGTIVEQKDIPSIFGKGGYMGT